MEKRRLDLRFFIFEELVSSEMPPRTRGERGEVVRGGLCPSSEVRRSEELMGLKNLC